MTLYCWLFAGVFIEAPTEFTVDARSVTPNGEGKVEAILTTPTNRRIQTLVSNNKDGTYPVLYTPMEQGNSFMLYPVSAR